MPDKNIAAPNGHMSAKPALTKVRHPGDQPPPAINEVIDTAPSGLCSTIARNVPNPSSPAQAPCSNSACTLAPKASPSISVCTLNSLLKFAVWPSIQTTAIIGTRA